MDRVPDVPDPVWLVHECVYGKSGLGQRKPSVWTQNSAIQDHAAGLQGNSGIPSESVRGRNAPDLWHSGGVPHYINKLDVRDSVDEALMENLFDRSSYLYEEPANLLKQELREPAIYNAIIKAIAEGASRLNDITTKVGEENSVVAKYLKTLIDLGIVKKETPITEKPGKKNDLSSGGQFFSFLIIIVRYRFVPVNASAIDSGRIAKTYPMR